MTKTYRRSILAASLFASPLVFLLGCGNNKPETGTQGNTVLPADTTGKMQKGYERNMKIQAAQKSGKL